VSQSSAGESASLGALIGGLANDIQDLVRGEIALGRAEFEQKLDRVIMAAIWLLGGALLAFAGLVVLLQGVAAILALMMPAWLALLIVGVIVTGVGAAFAKSGMAMLSLKTLAPDRTTANLRKDAQLLKEHT
jgi:drug/metabolite transporter (DMT)-like permease